MTIGSPGVHGHLFDSPVLIQPDAGLQHLRLASLVEHRMPVAVDHRHAGQALTLIAGQRSRLGANTYVCCGM